ncbi:LOW QUALITY PROTEIN: protein kinase C-binding protein 1, partial [Manduca sexta]|uniref:LOW QUALITY PROTEIN: protein kinase C-binding protein 1 n=1 Tax=Manduca sexta TaxID=7130 RepID=UPI001890A237
SIGSRSPAMKKISLGMLCELLQHALERMMDVNGVEPFMSPVDLAAFPDYDKYVVHPMDLSLMKTNIAKGLYGSTEAFMTDAQWILHNSIIFNTLQSKLTGGARALVRSCRAEMGEIEACPECYAAAHARRPTWFTDVCSTPHILLWAKLKGFPHWPAKGMSVSAAGLVDVRFFGAHDRAWVPAKDCFLYSEKDPNNFRTKRQDILESMQEAEQHIRNISRKYGKFVYPPFKTQFEPNKLNEQLKMMIPTFEGEVRVPQNTTKHQTIPGNSKKKSRSNSKSSKSSCNDGDISEVEDPLSTSRKGDSVDGNEDDFSTEKAKIMEVDISKTKDNKETENAIITILDNYTLEKRKRMDDGKTDNTLEPSSSKEPNPKEKNAEMAKDNPVEKIDSTSKDEESTKSIAKEKSESLVVAPLKISFGAIKNGKQTVKVTNAKESPKATTSNDKTPIIALRTSTPKEEKVITAQKMKTKIDKLFIDKTKGEKVKSDKRRNSKSNKSLIGNTTPKTETSLPEKKNEKVDEPSTSTKEKPREFVTATRSKTTDTDKTPNDKNNSTPTNSKLAKERLNFDDDTTLAVIARENNKTSVITSSGTGLPTISSVRSLSTVASTSSTPTTSSISKMIEVTIEGNPNASIFTPTSTDPIRTMKEATTKLQKLRADTEPLVGRVGVRAFARMTSPDRSKNNDVQVEIKAEPIDLDDADRHMEKMDLMNAFKLRPVNPPSNLREVRMNEVVITPLNRRTATKVPEIRPRAKKTFPHPKKPEDGQLNGKNSMVYIPIQPPATQPPRITRALPAPAAAPAASAAASHRAAAHATTTGQCGLPAVLIRTTNIVNTVTSPLVPVITSMPPAATTTSQVVQTIPTIGQVPTTVHTVPLMTSVNGQWMFSLQPVMSVGGVDTQASPPLLNGVADRSLVPAATATPAPAPAPAPAPSPAPAPPAAAATLATIAPIAPVTLTNRPTTETSPPGEPPRLQQRPQLLNPLDSNTPIGTVPPPSSAGPLTAKLNQNAVKLTDFFRTLLEDSLEKLDEPATQLTTLRLQLEQAKWRHQQQIDELKHNHELTLAEIRAAFEKDKMRAVNEARRLAHAELEAAVKQTKAKQWCANCSQEAQFYCCWNTSYCDYPCQRAHWSTHFNVCTQKASQDLRKGNGDSSNPSENRLQPQPENLPALQKSTTTPALTVGGKVATPRPFTPDQQNAAQKTSIIMSMVEDNSGNQTMKCVGTYTAQKPPPPVPAASTPQVASIILNKQLMSEEANGNKKVVTSGGYLIVGAGVNAGVTAAASRRMHTIQYYT